MPSATEETVPEFLRFQCWNRIFFRSVFYSDFTEAKPKNESSNLGISKASPPWWGIGEKSWNAAQVFVSFSFSGESTTWRWPRSAIAPASSVWWLSIRSVLITTIIFFFMRGHLSVCVSLFAHVVMNKKPNEYRKKALKQQVKAWHAIMFHRPLYV